MKNENKMDKMTTQQKYFLRNGNKVSENYLGLDCGQQDKLYDLILCMHPQELKELLDYVSSMVKQDETQPNLTGFYITDEEEGKETSVR